MSDDLKKRLRDLNDETMCFDGEATYALIHQAAARIEALEGDVNRLTNLLNEQRGLASHNESKCSSLTADLDVAREALEPFLFGSNPALEEALWGDQPDDAKMTITLKWGAYKRARAALSRLSKPEGGLVMSGYIHIPLYKHCREDDLLIFRTTYGAQIVFEPEDGPNVEIDVTPGEARRIAEALSRYADQSEADYRVKVAAE